MAAERGQPGSELPNKRADEGCWPTRCNPDCKVKGLCVGQAEQEVASNTLSCSATHLPWSGGTRQETGSAQTGQDLPAKSLHTQKATDRYHFQGNGPGSVCMDSRKQVGQMFQGDGG